MNEPDKPLKECWMCHHIWTARVASPVCCPCCHSDNWNLGRDRQTPKRKPTAYPNVRLLKLRKKQKIAYHYSCCEDCDTELPSSTLHIHHLDGSKDNHDYNNLRLLCPSCHTGTYHPPFAIKSA